MVPNVSSENAVSPTAITEAETLKHAPGLAQYIRDKSISVVTCSGFRQMISTCRQLTPCVVFADISLLASADLTEFMRAVDLDQSIKVLVVVGEDDREFCLKLVRMGFAGTINRSAPAAVFRRALDAIGNGELWASRNITSALIREFLFETRPMGLTNREREILGLVAKGYKNQEIADALFVSRETIRWHLRGIYSKLGVPDRKRAIEYALTKGTTVPANPNGSERVSITKKRASS